MLLLTMPEVKMLSSSVKYFFKKEPQNEGKVEVGNKSINQSHCQLLKIGHTWKLGASSFDIYILGRQMDFLIKTGIDKRIHFSKTKTVNQRQQSLLTHCKVGWKRNKGNCLISCPLRVAIW